MFGFSLAKLVVASVLIFAVWYGFKMMNRIGEVRAANLKDATKPNASPRIDVEDLTECKRCGAFVAANARACGRGDCPYPR